MRNGLALEQNLCIGDGLQGRVEPLRGEAA
jgi:hypothetical protein